MTSSRLSIAVQELEQALAALDETMQHAAQKMQDTHAGLASGAVPDADANDQVKAELVAVRKMVNDAAELIALARTADTAKDPQQGSEHPEIH